jgi:pimeloyl-ACP methyl ester carboxylesterase
MANHITVNGVHTWYQERGKGDPLLLLHGGFSDSREFTGNLDTLADRFRLYLPDRRGHGHTPDVDGPITARLMAEDMIAFVDKVIGGPTRVIGYSAGASVALLMALGRPDLVDRLVLISGVYHSDGLIYRPTPGVQMPPAVAAAYGEVSPDGVGHFQVVVDKVVKAVAEEPGLEAAELAGVTCPTLVMSGDDDIVTLGHTVQLYRGLTKGQLAIIPATSHLLLMEKPELTSGLVADFLTGSEPVTMMPVRRA